MKHLYEARIDIRKGRRWYVNADTLNIVANGDAGKAIRKVERVGKRLFQCDAVRVTSIRQVTVVDAV